MALCETAKLPGWNIEAQSAELLKNKLSNVNLEMKWLLHLCKYTVVHCSGILVA